VSFKGEQSPAFYDLRLPVKVSTPLFGKVAVNIEYITSAIKYFSMCQMELNSPSSPMKFTGDIEGLTVLVMPMFVEW
jgi:DNA polymerase III sliding clamp (beta) subunit (PCNA family)